MRIIFRKTILGFQAMFIMVFKMCETVTLSAIVRQEGKLQVAWCPELDIASQGKDIEEALKNLQEAVELYLEDEDAKVPKGKSPVITTLSVETHAKTTSNIRP